MTRAKYVAALDIGTTKICAIIAQVTPEGEVQVVGVGQYPSYGLKKGVVVNIGSTVESIKRAVNEAESMAGVCIESAVVGIAGSHIKSFNSTGVVGIQERDVTQLDIDRVIEAAKSVPLEQDREILHVIPQYFRVDGQEFVQDSLGMYGVRLEAQVHIVTGAISSAQNIIKSCELAGIRVHDIVLEQLASAQAVLTHSERELGVSVLDIGGGTADFAVYKDDRILYSKVFPIAGNHFTNDIAIGLGVPIQKAEEIKKEFGVVSEEAYYQLGHNKVSISLDYEGGQKEIDTYSLLEILQPRADEIFAFLKDDIEQNRLIGHMPAGLVITGGGSLLNGLQAHVQKMFNVPIRIGRPEYYFTNQTGGMVPELLRSPVYATAYGLLSYAMVGENNLLQTPDNVSVITKVFRRMKSWIHDFI